MPILQLISIAVALLLGLIVIIRNPSDRNRWLLLFFNAAIALWIVSYIAADVPSDLSLLWNRATFLTALTVVFGGYLLVASLSKRLNAWAWLHVGALVGAAVVALATPFLVEDIVPRYDAAGMQAGYDVIRGVGYPLYVLALVGLGGGVVTYALYMMRKSHGRFKAQLRIIVGGFAAMLIVGVTTGVILPLALQSSEPANYTFLSAFVVMSAFAYAIVQQRFFNLRLALARSLGYFITLAAITVFYAVAVFSLAELLFRGQTADLGVRIYYIVAAIAVALTFQPLKQFVSRLTRRVFFHDTYETQEVFDRLTSLLVGTVEIGALTNQAATILKDAMRVEYLHIALPNRDGPHNDVLKEIESIKDWPLVTDELSQGSKIANKLYESNIALVTRIKTHTEVVGYIVCGPKQRGDVLTNQDIDLIRVAGDELAVAIQNALRFEEIMHFNETLRQEVADATAQLRQSNKKLHKLDEAKDEFISMASHQLRTPLTSVKGYLSMALEGDAGDLNQPQRKLLEEAYTSAQRMVYLIGDFLNVSRLQTGKFVLEQRPVALGKLIMQEIDQLQVTAQRRNIHLMFAEPQHFPPLMLDEDKMRQVIMNFIDNAIFYSRPGGTVQIELLATAKDVRLTVKDSGIGVPAAERHKIFDKFFRAENARRVRPDGTGIGLFMAKKVVAAHGGSMIFESTEAKGSTFGFSLPVSLRQ